jgi:thioredoxin-like negative regulator of GroEL
MVRKVPTLVLVKGRHTVARLEGRANAAEIEELVDEHLDEDAKSVPRERP